MDSRYKNQQLIELKRTAMRCPTPTDASITQIYIERHREDYRMKSRQFVAYTRMKS